jgi:hypothetical protein
MMDVIRAATQAETAVRRAMQGMASATATEVPTLAATTKNQDAAGGPEKSKGLPDLTTAIAEVDTPAVEVATAMIGVAMVAETGAVRVLVGAIRGDRSMGGTGLSIRIPAPMAVEVACAMQARIRGSGEVVRYHGPRLLGGGCVNRFAYMHACVAPCICIREGQMPGLVCKQNRIAVIIFSLRSTNS